MNTRLMHEDKQALAGNGSANQRREPRLSAFRPDVDIFETADAYHLFGDLPGVTADRLEITLERGVLTVRGEAAQRWPKEARPITREYSIGDYSRSFNIGEDIDPERIEASIKEGVLTLRLPKMENVQPRRIQVKAG